MRIIKLNNQIKKRIIFFILIFICFSGSIILISYSLKDQIAYFVTPTELKDIDYSKNKFLRVGGLVKENSLVYENNVWSFEVVDENLLRHLSANLNLI